MDMKFKGIAWVGNIYQKFEAICEEVDDFMSQDKDKHEKNQIQAGCNTVRKFCKGVMQDLLLPPSDTYVRESVYDSLPPAKSEVSVPREDSNPEQLLESPTQKSHDEACDKLAQKSVPVSIEVNIYDPPEKANVDSEKVADALISIHNGSVSQPCESLLPVILDNVGDNGIVLPGCDISSSTDIVGKVFSFETRETMPLVESLEDGHNQHGRPVWEVSLPETETDVYVAPMWDNGIVLPGCDISSSTDIIGKVFPFETCETTPLVESLEAGYNQHGRPVWEASLPDPETDVYVASMCEVLPYKTRETMPMVESSEDGHNQHGRPVCKGSLPNPELLLESPTQKSHEEACDKLTQKSVPVSIQVKIHDTPEKAGVNSEKVANALVSIHNGSVSQPCESLLPVILDNVGDNGIVLPGCDISSSTDIIGEVFPFETCETMPLVESLEDGHNQHGKPVWEASLPDPEMDAYVASMCEDFPCKTRETMPLVESFEDGHNQHGRPVWEASPTEPETIVCVAPVCCDISSSTSMTGKVFPCITCETMPLVESLEDGRNQLGRPVRNASLPKLETDVCVASMSPTGRSSDSDWQEEYKSSSMTERSIETMDEFEDVNLHDDCSDSEFLKNEICFIYQKARRKISYKEKLRGALASKLRPTKNQDYEQIAIWYAEAESKRRSRKLSTSTRDLLTERLQTHDSCDSDWELL